MSAMNVRPSSHAGVAEGTGLAGTLVMAAVGVVASVGGMNGSSGGVSVEEPQPAMPKPMKTERSQKDRMQGLYLSKAVRVKRKEHTPDRPVPKSCVLTR